MSPSVLLTLVHVLIVLKSYLIRHFLLSACRFRFSNCVHFVKSDIFSILLYVTVGVCIKMQQWWNNPLYPAAGCPKSCNAIPDLFQSVFLREFSEQASFSSLSLSFTQTPTHKHLHIHAYTHSSNYGNQQADPISVSCLLSPRGWLPDHLTLHNLICNDRVWHPDFWPYQLLVCVFVFVHMCMCEI